MTSPGSSPPVLRALPRGEAHLYLVDPATVEEPQRVRGYLQLLTPAERTRHDRFRFPEHRHHYLVTRALVRTTLSRYAPIRPEEWRFSSNPHGRPMLEGGPEAEWLRFNLSNTDGLVACLVVRDREAGVDVENLERNGNAPGVAERFFAPAEVQALQALPEAEQRDRFFRYWTLKESYLKARGLGLSVPLADFAFQLEGEEIRLRCQPSLGEDGEGWQFQMLTPTPRHLTAVALRRGAEPPLTLDVQWVRPEVP